MCVCVCVYVRVCVSLWTDNSCLDRKFIPTRLERCSFLRADLRTIFTVFLSRFGAFLESSSTFAKQLVHFSKHHGLPAKASLLLKILSSSLKSKYLCQ